MGQLPVCGCGKITLPVFKGQGDEHTHNGNWTSNGDAPTAAAAPAALREHKTPSAPPAPKKQMHRLRCGKSWRCSGTQTATAVGHMMITSTTSSVSRCDKGWTGPHAVGADIITTAHKTMHKAGEPFPRHISCTTSATTVTKNQRPIRQPRATAGSPIWTSALTQRITGMTQSAYRCREATM